MSRRRGSIVPLLAIGLACGGGDGPAAPDPCATAPRLEVWGGTRPTFAWAPACPADHLSVVDVTPGGDGHVMWTTGSAGGLGSWLRPQVRYPDVAADDPPGPPEALVSGRQYRVHIEAWKRNDGFCLVGCPTVVAWSVTATFTP